MIVPQAFLNSKSTWKKEKQGTGNNTMQKQLAHTPRKLVSPTEGYTFKKEPEMAHARLAAFLPLTKCTCLLGLISSQLLT